MAPRDTSSFHKKRRCFFVAKIYLVRHAESVANSQGIYQGQTYNTGLSRHGNMQAQLLAQRFQSIDVDEIFASPLIRTYRTASYVAKAKKLSVCVEQAIIETNHGAWEGKYKLQVAKLWPELYQKWRKNPSQVIFPKGETFQATTVRTLNWWGSLVNKNKHILIVTHDNIIRIIVVYLLGMPLDNIWRFHLTPTGLTMVDCHKGKQVISLLNDTNHLRVSDRDVGQHAL